MKSHGVDFYPKKKINKFKDNLRKSRGKIHRYLGKTTDAINDFIIIHNF